MRKILEVPYGTRDFLPRSAATKRSVEKKIMALFARYGYEEVVTPTLEYLETLTTGSGRSLEPHMFKMFDRNNRTLALRHEMTTPIARLVSSRLRGDPMPLKLSYNTSVFRYEQTLPGRQCEFYQAGVELLGASSTAADAEIIALAVESLRAAGLNEFEICLGQVEFANGLMNQCALDPETQSILKSALETHNIVEFERIVDGLSLTEELSATLKRLPYMHGDREILDRAGLMVSNERSRQALENLNEIYRLLESYGAVDRIKFDLGLIRDFNYYTGMVFEAYAPGLGYSLAGGGRYDHMLKDFGMACPATGFAVGIERVLIARKRQGLIEDVRVRDVYIGYSADKISDAIETANKLRAEGKTVELALNAQTKDEADGVQRSKCYERLIYVD